MRTITATATTTVYSMLDWPRCPALLLVAVRINAPQPCLLRLVHDVCDHGGAAARRADGEAGLLDAALQQHDELAAARRVHRTVYQGSPAVRRQRLSVIVEVAGG